MSDKAKLKRYNGSAFTEVYPLTTHDQIIASGTRSSSTFLRGDGVWATPAASTNNFLTGVSGSGNGTVTFTRSGLSSLTWNAAHTHAISNVTGLQDALNAKLNLTGGTMTGNLTIHRPMQDGTNAYTTPHLVLSSTDTTDTTGFVGMVFDTSTSANYGWSYGAQRTSDGNGDLIWRNHDTSAAGVERMRLLDNGNLGIGTTSPNEKLTFPYGANIGWEYSNTDSNVYHTIGKSANGAGALEFKQAWTNGDATIYSFFGNPGGTQTELLTIRNDGDIGIGTTSPTQKLHVNGNLRVNNIYLADRIYHDGDTNTYINMAGTDDFQIIVGGRQMLRMDEGTDPDRLRFVTDNDWTDSSGNWNMSGSLTVGGNIAVSGTVDGVDIAALNTTVSLKANLASPALTGIPTAPTASFATNTTQLATTAFVQTALSGLVASAPATLDTLNELAAALGDDPNFATTVANSIGTKAPLASPTFTGTVTAPTIEIPTPSGYHAKIFYGQFPNPAGSLNSAVGDGVSLNNFGQGNQGIIIQSGGGDTGGLKITDDGVFIFGASDTGLFSIIDEDSNTSRFSINSLGNTTVNGTLTVNSSVSATSFSGSGASLTSLNGSNISSGTISTARLGITATATELNYTDGVTSNIQTQLNNRLIIPPFPYYNPVAGSILLYNTAYGWTTSTVGYWVQIRGRADADLLTSTGASGATRGSILVGAFAQGDTIMMEVSDSSAVSAGFNPAIVTFTLGAADITPDSILQGVSYRGTTSSTTVRYEYEFSVGFSGSTLYFDNHYRWAFIDTSTASSILGSTAVTLFVGRIWRLNQA